ncbi:MAG TPA: alpha/beta fold hydrolase [Anaerolineales bacterium]|nr:alpha/beta fold hydrolase [Anaerolineales bacterium]
MPLAADISYSEHRGGALLAEGPPLILIHGAGGTRLHWPPQIRRMPGKHVLAADLPGHGESPGEGEGTIDAYADRLWCWLDAIGQERVVLVGHSMGGAIALTMALGVRQKVAGLVLVGSGAALPVNPRILELAADATSAAKAVDLIIRWAFAPSATARLVELSRTRMASAPSRVLQADFLACDRFDLRARLGEVAAAGLILCGRHDRMTPLSSSETLLQGIPGARLAVIEDAGHMVMLEQPEAVTAVLRRFLDETFPSREAAPRAAKTGG